MKDNVIIIILFSLLLTACIPPKPPQGYNISKNEASLAEASYSVSRSLVDLAEINQAAHPVPRLAAPLAPSSYGMGGLTSVDWSGPVAPLVRQIAKAADYQLTILGTAPGIPILVTVYQKNAALGDILRDIGYQCGERAMVTVFAERRIIELRYASN